MYTKRYGILETLAPLHIGASAGEETGNLNLIFRDQFTQTGIIPGSSIRGRFRADMRQKRQWWLEDQLKAKQITIPDPEVEKIEVEEGNRKKLLSRLEWLEQRWLEVELEAKQVAIPDPKLEKIEVEEGGKKKLLSRLEWLKFQAKKKDIQVPALINDNHWYGKSVASNDSETTEAFVKFEYASLVWLPVFCPGQPVVWVTCPWLLKRYKQIAQIKADLPRPYTAPKGLQGRQVEARGKILFFNLGFLELEHEAELSDWIPPEVKLNPNNLVVVDDNDIAMIHDMALYRQSRVKLSDTEKKVDGGAFFNVEALPEGSVMVFPIALRQPGWQPFETQSSELYFGGLESIGFGRCRVTLAGDK
ncbi:RAMP superfamily CRISPR-associated protein [Phormidesmis sp. 146-35]